MSSRNADYLQENQVFTKEDDPKAENVVRLYYRKLYHLSKLIYCEESKSRALAP